jgi:hypothetical protein
VRLTSAMSAGFLILGLWLLGSHLASADNFCGREAFGSENHPSIDSEDMRKEGRCHCAGPVSCCKLPRTPASAGRTLFVFTLSRDERLETGPSTCSFVSEGPAFALKQDRGAATKILEFFAGPPLPLFLLHLSVRC